MVMGRGVILDHHLKIFGIFWAPQEEHLYDSKD